MSAQLVPLQPFQLLHAAPSFDTALAPYLAATRCYLESQPGRPQRGHQTLEAAEVMRNMSLYGKALVDVTWEVRLLAPVLRARRGYIGTIPTSNMGRNKCRRKLISLRKSSSKIHIAIRVILLRQDYLATQNIIVNAVHASPV